MRKSSIAVLLAVVILLSGVAGFGGAYVSNLLFAPVPVTGTDAGTAPPDTPYANRPASDAPSGTDDAATDGDTVAEPSDTLNDDIKWLAASGDGAQGKELAIPEIAALASGSVVEIYTESVTSGGRLGQYVSEGAGSGVVITGDGYIVTNNHVIEGARKITVRMNNGKDYDATLIGRDSKTDLAVIKVNATELHFAVFGDSDSLVVGELAVAIGNPLGKLGGTVSEGIISALSRSIEIDGNMMTLLQTTAAVNPGNSGGGLFDRFGRLIGVVNAKSSGNDIEGIGFAIPANLAKNICEDLIEYGFVPGRVDFGASLINILDSMTAFMYRVSATGVYVAQVDEGGTLQAGDRIVSIGGVEIKSIADINALLDNCSAGDKLQITVSRSGRTVTVEHTLKQATS